MIFNLAYVCTHKLVFFGRPWSGSFGGPNGGPLVAELTPEGTIPKETFEKGNVHTVEEALQVAKRIGYENGIMIKASEGGGGKGIRLVFNEKDLPDMFLQVQNEVVGSPIFLMQLCQNNRHIEIQIVGDQHGNAVAFSGRDCSTQRRFQKIFEEGPPIVVPPETFKLMEKNAQKLTQSIGYQGAGTVEYLYNADENKFYFLELNPRLQVEHPVSESITDVRHVVCYCACIAGKFVAIGCVSCLLLLASLYFTRSISPPLNSSAPWVFPFTTFLKSVAIMAAKISMEQNQSISWRKTIHPLTTIALPRESRRKIPTKGSSQPRVPLNESSFKVREMCGDISPTDPMVAFMNTPIHNLVTSLLRDPIENPPARH